MEASGLWHLVKFESPCLTGDSLTHFDQGRYLTSLTTEMNLENDSSGGPTVGVHPNAWNLGIGVITLVIVAVALFTVLWFALTGSQNGVITKTVAFPVGVVDSSEPSSMAPPGAHALKGYKLNYVTDFNGTTIPQGWYSFSGVPGGLPGGHFAKSHVVVNHGLLQLNTWRDPRFHNHWVTGGLCQCGLGHAYQAYFVRSRITGAGTNEVELLWPLKNNWPPEVDFNETGAHADQTSSTVHWGIDNHIEQITLKVNMKRWHTWGVIWSPASIIYTVDGRQWGSITNPVEIPRQPMRLDFEQRTNCPIKQDCATRPVSMQIDWVAEYAPR